VPIRKDETPQGPKEREKVKPQISQRHALKPLPTDFQVCICGDRVTLQ